MDAVVTRSASAKPALAACGGWRCAMSGASSSHELNQEDIDDQSPWYLSLDAIQGSPSHQFFTRKYGSVEKGRSKEQEVRLTTCAFLQESGQKLRLCASHPGSRGPLRAAAVHAPPSAALQTLCLVRLRPPPRYRRALHTQASVEHRHGDRLLSPIFCT